MMGGIISMLGGILAASTYIIAKKPSAKAMMDKIAPYQGWIGLTMLLWGVYELFACLRHISVISAAPMHWTFWFLTGVSDFGVGFILGFALITKYALSKNETAQEKGNMFYAKLAKFQVPLGFLAIVMGLLFIVV